MEHALASRQRVGRTPPLCPKKKKKNHFGPVHFEHMGLIMESKERAMRDATKIPVFRVPPGYSERWVTKFEPPLVNFKPLAMRQRDADRFGAV